MSASFAQPSIPSLPRQLDSPSTPVPTFTSSEPISKTYKAYFSQNEVDQLFTNQRGKLTTAKAEKIKQVACGFIDAVGLRIGFPRRVIATGQALYHRFHLYFPLKDFNYIEVSLSTLYAAAKLHDTLKKPRDLILASYAIRHPELLKGRLTLSVDPASIDPKQLESERKRILSIERLVLETLCFNFIVGAEGSGSPGLDVFGLSMKLGKRGGYRKKFIYTAWKMIIDSWSSVSAILNEFPHATCTSYRTTASLSYTPQTICMACFYATAILYKPPAGLGNPDGAFGDVSRTSHEEKEMISDIDSFIDVVARWDTGSLDTWLQGIPVAMADIHDIVHLLLDLHVFILQSSSRPTTTTSELAITPSYGTPVSPSDLALSASAAAASGTQPARTALAQSVVGLGTHPQLIPVFTLPPRQNWTQERLMELKIWLRGHYDTRMRDTEKKNGNVSSPTSDSEEVVVETTKLTIETLTAGLGRNDATIRFLFW
ncbi:hypothetical protein QFC21_002944 [Naganishia friedmannii]|uniref:Uncharacterized protein n=1 Tax=Naganishia friedmannii TaxID=89922 RepID=A0ACC2VTU7_9TREE|nr:hypothetical protein QFC21_002944 [Naganishia friedmannii]